MAYKNRAYLFIATCEKEKEQKGKGACLLTENKGFKGLSI